VLWNCVEKLNCVVKNLVGRKKEKKRTNCLFCFTTRDARKFVYSRIMDGSAHMGDIQLVAMAITKGKPCRVGCTIQRVKQHYKDHKHESFCLTPSLLLDITCNLRHELELDL
jgi:hypothetical protein